MARWAGERRCQRQSSYHSKAEAHEATLVARQAQEHARIQKRQADRPGVKAMPIVLGQHVMVQSRGHFRSKLERRWVGPAKIVQVNKDGHTAIVEYMGRGASRKETVHVRRMQPFDIGTLEKSSELLQHAELTSAKTWEFKKFSGLRKRGRAFEIKVEWSGDFEPTWEPIAAIAKDAKVPLLAYLGSTEAKESVILQDVLRLPFVRRLVSKGGSVTV